MVSETPDIEWFLWVSQPIAVERQNPARNWYLATYVTTAALHIIALEANPPPQWLH